MTHQKWCIVQLIEQQSSCVDLHPRAYVLGRKRMKLNIRKYNKGRKMNQIENLVVCAKEEEMIDRAKALAQKLGVPLCDEIGKELTLLVEKEGLSLCGYGLSYMGDFEKLLKRVSKGRLFHEMLVHVAKTKKENPIAIDATAGMGEDAFLLAAYGYKVYLFEQNPVVAALLSDAMDRALEQDELSQIIARMHLVEKNSIEGMEEIAEEIDLIYLDPMFPARQKSGLINKKLQLIQKLEQPCMREEDLLEAAIAKKPKKIVIKRPLKGANLADKKPSYTIKGKAIRYDCLC